MANVQLDLWGNPVSIPEKEKSSSGNNSSAKQETFDDSSFPPSFPLFKDEESIEPISPYTITENSTETFIETTTDSNLENNLDSNDDVTEDAASENKVEAIINDTITITPSNEVINDNVNSQKETIHEHTTVIQPKQEEVTESNTISNAENQSQDENRVVYSDTQILVKLKGRPKGSTNQELVKKDVPASYSSINTPGKRGRKSFKEIDSSVDLVNVPDDETLKKKLYHGISEVADWFGVNNSQIRYWENEFDVLKPRKTRKGDRLFRFEDVKTLQLIHHLLRNRKFSVEGAKEYLKSNKQQADIHFELSQSLNKFRSFLIELKSNLGV